MFNKGYVIMWEPFDSKDVSKKPYFKSIGGTTFDIKKARKYSSVQEACHFVPKMTSIGYRGPIIKKV